MVVSDRTYGNWRKPRTVGMGGFSGLATAVTFGGLIAAVIAQLIGGWLAGLVVLILVGITLALIVVKDRHGLTVAARVGERVMWWSRKAGGGHVYRAGGSGVVPWGTHQLPGILAKSKLSEFEDSYGRPFAMVELPGAYYSLVFRGEPDGQSLVDQSDVDRWVALWGSWLSGLGQEQGVVGAAVTIETAPDTGTRLRREVEANVVSNSPAIAQQMLRETIVELPAGSAVVRAYVTVSFSATPRAGMKRRSTEEMAKDLATRIPAMIGELSQTGAGMVRPMTALELSRVVRTAYDPAADALFDEASMTGQEVDVSWAEAGPAATEATWDTYRHDSGVSMTWSMTDAPRGLVHSGILARLLGPHHAIARKRVTILYRPIEAGRASQIVEADVRAARVRATSSQNAAARVGMDLAYAEATAKEEARGAGLENFAMLVTATGTGETELANIAATVDSLAAQARITLRRCYGAQDSAFACCLPVGLVPMRHSAVPEMVREAL